MNYTATLTSTNPAADASKIPIADIYCTGSDQVWGEIAQDDVDPMYFLSFAPHDVKKIAFSASFGKESYPKERIDKFRELLHGYDYITVREDSAVNIVNMAGYEATQILDPTMIFGGDRWKEQLLPIHEKGYVLLYQLNANHEMDEYAKQFADKAGLWVRNSLCLFPVSIGSCALRWNSRYELRTAMLPL